MSRNQLLLTVHGRHEPMEVSFPAKWVICGACEGHATTTRHIECDGGGFTASEWADACDDDPDFAEDYFGGRYDRPCPDCDGLGRVQAIDEEAVTGWRQKILLKAFFKEGADEAEYRAMVAAERRMGA